MGQREVIGFVGLGAMGGPMAANLVKAGFSVVGFDPDPQRKAEAEAAGIEVVSSGSEAAQATTQTVISMVRDWRQTEAALLGLDGFASAARDGMDLIVMSTLDPTLIRLLAETLATRGIDVIDAPVSGGRAGAIDARLSIFVSGSNDIVTRIHPLLEAMGRNIFLVGDQVGMGQAAKLANQLMLAVNIVGAYEAQLVASTHGLLEQQLMKLASVSTGGSWVTENWDLVQGFWEADEIDLIYKDLGLAITDGQAQGMSMQISTLAYQVIRDTWHKEKP